MTDMSIDPTDPELADYEEAEAVFDGEAEDVVRSIDGAQDDVFMDGDLDDEIGVDL